MCDCVWSVGVDDVDASVIRFVYCTVQHRCVYTIFKVDRCIVQVRGRSQNKNQTLYCVAL